MLKDFDNHYKVYLDKCIGLVNTMTIKSNKAARDMNISVYKRTGKMVGEDKTTWKYYLHVSGQYHPTDEPMYITSVDTTQKIIFNQENLKLHKNTRKEYRFGTHMYEELVERYPSKELLIKGILNPCDIHTAINSPDGTILSYDKDYVEYNEYSLMEDLQNHIYQMYSRWYQKQYNIDNQYYNAVYMGILYQKLVEVVMQIRLDKCLTNEAHSYHYRRFLASHGFLDFYLDHLTIRQVLILYKNIRWVERYIGQRFTQKWLIKHLFTLRNLPIAEYNMVQTYNDIVRDVQAMSKFEKVSLNHLESINPEIDTLSLEKLMDKETPLAPFNFRERPFEEKQAREQLSSSLNAELKTKVLESRVIDWTDSEEHILPDVLLDHFIVLLKRKAYRAFISVNHPMTGALIPLSGDDALILLTYAVYQYLGHQTDIIPKYHYGLVPRKTRPTETEIRRTIPDNTMISQKWMNHLLVESYTALKPIMNTVDFYEQAKYHFDLLNNLINLAKMDEDLDATAYKLQTVYSLYTYGVYDARKNGIDTFTKFISHLALDVKNLRQNDWFKLAKDIWLKVSGLDNVTVLTTNNISKAILGLMTHLSSYSVHYIRDINEEPMQYTAMRSTRLKLNRWDTFGQVEQESASLLRVLDTKTNIIEISDTDELSIPIKIIERQTDVMTLKDVDVGVNLLSGTGVKSTGFTHTYNNTTYSWVEGDDIQDIQGHEGIPPIPGVRSWLLLPEEVKLKYIDAYGNKVDWEPVPVQENEPKEPLGWVIRNDNLDGLDYHEK